MEITYIGLSECYKEIISRAEHSEYIWIISLIARYADCENIYTQIEHDWASLNDLTGKKILFLFSSPNCKEYFPFFNKMGDRPYVGKVCPFVEMLDRGHRFEIRDGFNCNYPDYDKIDWKLKHSQTISEFAKNNSIAEENIPCLYFYNIRNGKTKILPLQNYIDVYSLIKNIIIYVDSLYDRLLNVEICLKEFQQIEDYIKLFMNINEMAEHLDCNQKEAIHEVLINEKTYLDVKNQITDKQIRKDLKRIKQWDRQFFACFVNDSNKQKEYWNLKNEHAILLEMMDQQLDDVGLNYNGNILNARYNMDKKETIKLFLSYSWKDDELANQIYEYFKEKHGIEIHRDKVDIGAWESIREYMDSIPEMDYVILLISDDYLRSVNCMYEVMEIMRSKTYQNRIFPIVITKEIYDAVHRVRYVKYWMNEYSNLEAELRGVPYEALGNLGRDLKKLGDIKNNIVEFLDTIKNMNNPEIADVNKKIEEKLREKGFVGDAYKIKEMDIANTVPSGIITVLNELQKSLKS